MSTSFPTPAQATRTDATGAQEQPQGGDPTAGLTAPGPPAAGPPATGPASSGPPAPPRRGRLHGFRALRWPGFRIYVVGMLFRGLAMWMPLVSIPWLAVQLGATPAEVGIITGFFFLPTLFVGPLGGVLADRFDRRVILVVAQSAAAVISAVIFLLVVSGSQTLPLLALSSFGYGMLIAIEVPVRQAFMTELVPHADISSAANLHATTWNTTRLLGPVVAGLLIATVGAAAPFAFTFVAAVLVTLSFLWMDRYRDRGRQRADRTHSILSDLRGGLSFALRNPVVRYSLLLIWAAAMFGIAAFMTLAPLFARDELGLAADGYGAFLGASGAGALTAALLVTTFAHGDRRPWLAVGVLAMALLVGGVSVARHADAVFVLAFLLGAAQITLAQNALVSVHSATPDALRGRVMGIWVMTFQGSSLLGSILSGSLANALGVRPALLISSVLLGIVGVAAIVAIRRADWHIAPPTAPTPATAPTAPAPTAPAPTVRSESGP